MVVGADHAHRSGHRQDFGFDGEPRPLAHRFPSGRYLRRQPDRQYIPLDARLAGEDEMMDQPWDRRQFLRNAALAGSVLALPANEAGAIEPAAEPDRKSTRLNSSHLGI